MNKTSQCGANNPFWKGGRSIASNGYVLLRVGLNHPLADVRGYAYEHRLIAEQKIGRALIAGEVVHHRDGNKRNNIPENLEVVNGNAEHYVRHRKYQGRRLPGEENPIIACGCGCGEHFNKYDNGGRPRMFITGHNTVLQRRLEKCNQQK
jgi:predicted phosphodiesterase